MLWRPFYYFPVFIWKEDFSRLLYACKHCWAHKTFNLAGYICLIRSVSLLLKFHSLSLITIGFIFPIQNPSPKGGPSHHWFYWSWRTVRPLSVLRETEKSGHVICDTWIWCKRRKTNGKLNINCAEILRALVEFPITRTFVWVWHMRLNMILYDYVYIWMEGIILRRKLKF